MPDPAITKQITTVLSTRQVRLSASQGVAVFDAIVYNDSDRFASFQLRLIAAGAITDGKPWYRLTPSVSAKIPVGDCTRFQIEIFDLPSIAQQFSGTIDLTVEVTSRELTNQYDRQPLRLIADSIQGQPPTVSLLLPVLEANPGDRVAIVAQIANPTNTPMEAVLRLQGLPHLWLSDGTQQGVSLLPGKPQKVAFQCEVPSLLEARSQIYPLQLEVMGRFPSVTATGQLYVRPAGALSLICEPLEATIPDRLRRWLNPAQGIAEFAIQLENRSNLEPGVQVEVQEVQPKRRGFWRKRETQPSPESNNPESSNPESSSNGVTLPAEVQLGEVPTAFPLGMTAIPLQIYRRLPWLGWTRSRQFQVIAHSRNPAIPLQPTSQSLKVYLFPIIPFWLQLLGALLALGLGAITWILLSDPGHRASVNSVRFNGQGSEVLSGSDDQTIRRWRVQNHSLQTQTRIGNLNKAVRVVRYRPVNNDHIAMGFENGEIQLANLLTGERSRLTPDKDDRVFDLVFSRDARTLFSAHGSGLVLQWDINRFNPEQNQPQRAYDLQFAIQSMALVGDTDTYLAIGGRYNRLMILEVALKPTASNRNQSSSPTNSAKSQSTFLDIAYPSGGATDYISSLSAAEQQPNLLAVADTKGQVSLWDIPGCLSNRGRCKPTDSWLGQGGNPVRSVALSADGCFLASAGEDGQVRLWALDGRGLRRSSALEGRVLGRTQKPVNAVDIIQTREAVWVTSGDADKQVRLYQVPLAGNRISNQCPVLGGGE
jgi:WD40 repeat protein